MYKGAIDQDSGYKSVRNHLYLALIVAVGLLIRFAFKGYTTPDTFDFLLPWYTFAKANGLGSLSKQFTNYTPFYSYLLIFVSQLDAYASPLTLIKLVSLCFEFGSALVAYKIVHSLTKSELRSTVAFATTWLAPTVLFNGALWGQADSIWNFFLLLAIYRVCRGHLGIIPFAIAFSVKAQAAFLGPFILGVLLKKSRTWLWLFTVPIIYIATTLPVVIAGGSLRQVLNIYIDQANTFHSLSMNAANFWAFVPNIYYPEGVKIGLALAVGAAFILVKEIVKFKNDSGEFYLLAACLSLLLMPYLLPKMHERYFYGFELASILLACVNPGYIIVAIISQIDGIFSYLTLGKVLGYSLFQAVLFNTVLAIFMTKQMLKQESPPPIPVRHFLCYVGLLATFLALLFYAGDYPSTVAPKILFTILCILSTIQLYIMLKQTVDY